VPSAEKAELLVKRLSCLLLVTVVIVTVATPANAAKRTGARTSGEGIVAEARNDPSRLPKRIGRRTSSISCSYYEQFGYVDTIGPAKPNPVGDAVKATQGSYVKICKNAKGDEILNKVVVIRPRTNAAELAQEALTYVPLPEPAPATSPARQSYVNFPTWLWLKEWTPVSATASIPGLSSTVVAEPREVIWRMGDGTARTCRGPGIPYDPRLPDAAQRTECVHVYRASSAGMGTQNAYVASVTVVYRVKWSATDGSRGNLGTLSTTTTFPMRVREVQTVNVRPPDPALTLNSNS
jgi:hypothetical protein